MSDSPPRLTSPPAGYADWLAELKSRIHTAQQRATLAVNRELVLLYWQIGRDILARQAKQGWGAKVIERLAEDLRVAFPEMKGFSPRNLKYMRAFAEAWPDDKFVQGALAQLPWYHQLALLDKLPGPETRLLERSGKAVTNFELTLPKPQSDLARESLKDPYRFDFLGLTDEAQEREIENALVKHVTEFLLELGAGFAFVGRQVLLDVAGDEFFIDLLFYHLKLRCYLVIELKGGKFKPEHLGQLSFTSPPSMPRSNTRRVPRPLAFCCARAKTRSSPSTRCATTPSRWASLNTSYWTPCRPSCRPACPALSRLSANWRVTVTRRMMTPGRAEI